MSISYVDDISDGRGIFIFVKLLSRWKGSLYKLVWIDVFMYVVTYYVLNISYRFFMDDKQKKIFRDIVKYCDNMKTNIPISFLLGFFVSGVIARWYQMYMYIPWMNRVSYTLMASMNNRHDDFIRNTRLTIMRYLNLSWILSMRQISDQIATRFQFQISNNQAQEERERKRRAKNNPDLAEESLIEEKHRNYPISVEEMEDMESLNDPLEQKNKETVSTVRSTLESFNEDRKVKMTFGKLITDAEITAFETIANQYFAKNRVKYNLEYWIPLQWACRVIQKATLHGMVVDPKVSFHIIEEIGRIRNQMQDLQIYSSIMIPLVYTQVVIIAAYSYFLCQLFSTQFLEKDEANPDKDGKNVDFYFPIFSVLSFLFLVGWLKVAMCVMNPFGDDDEDFQTSDILDYNLEVSYRCCYMDPSEYPPGLTAPNTNVKLLPGNEEDSLESYLSDISHEISDIKPPVALDELEDLQIPPSFAKKMYGCFKNKNKDEIITDAELETVMIEREKHQTTKSSSKVLTKRIKKLSAFKL